MPITPPTIRVVPSRLSLACHAVLAAGVLGLLVHYAPTWLGLGGALALAALLYALRRWAPRGELGYRPGALGGPGEWWWRAPGGRPEAVRLRVIYLGAWLIGLRLGRRTLWLWPDSSDRETLWALRRWLVRRG